MFAVEFDRTGYSLSGSPHWFCGNGQGHAVPVGGNQVAGTSSGLVGIAGLGQSQGAQ